MVTTTTITTTIAKSCDDGRYNATTRYGGDWSRAYIDVVTDSDFACDSRAVLDATAAKGLPAWQYRLDHTPLLLDV